MVPATPRHAEQSLLRPHVGSIPPSVETKLPGPTTPPPGLLPGAAAATRAAAMSLGAR